MLAFMLGGVHQLRRQVLGFLTPYFHTLLFSTLYSTEMSAFSLPILYCIERFEETKQKTKPSSEKVNQKFKSRHDQ